MKEQRKNRKGEKDKEKKERKKEGRKGLPNLFLARVPSSVATPSPLPTRLRAQTLNR